MKKFISIVGDYVYFNRYEGCKRDHGRLGEGG